MSHKHCGLWFYSAQQITNMILQLQSHKLHNTTALDMRDIQASVHSLLFDDFKDALMATREQVSARCASSGTHVLDLLEKWNGETSIGSQPATYFEAW